MSRFSFSKQPKARLAYRTKTGFEPGDEPVTVWVAHMTNPNFDFSDQDPAQFIKWHAYKTQYRDEEPKP